jgi:chondroitin 4-sulfotransferase 11
MRHLLRSMLPEILVRSVQKFQRRDLFNAFRTAGVAFIHVPRAAGTSISRSLYPLWVNHYTVVEHINTVPKDLLELPRFAVVRNPWDRVVSSWSFARAGSGPDGVVVRNPEHYRTEEFAVFERFVNEWLPRQQIERVDPIFRCQSDYLLDTNGNLAVNHLGRIEDLLATERWLSALLCRTVTIPRMNTSEHRPYRDYYTPELRKRVGQIYAEDIDRFGYRF